MAPESIIKRRLRTLREAKDSAEARAARHAQLTEERAERNGVPTETQERIDRPNEFARVSRQMPLAFYYGEGSAEGRDAAFARQRANFYAMCARVFGFTGWKLDGYEREIFAAAQIAGGRDGRGMKLLPMDQSQAVNLNANSAPLEWLVSQNELDTDADPDGYGMLRFAVALHFRDVVLGSQSGGLKAQAYGGGGGGFGPRLVSDYALDCMAAVSAVRDRLQPDMFSLLHQTVVDDVWVWEPAVRQIERRFPASRAPTKARERRRYERMRQALLRKRRDRVILRLQKAIDGAAVVFDYMSEAEYRRRWKVSLRSPGPSASR